MEVPAWAVGLGGAAVSVPLFMPFLGSLTRTRANYVPLESGKPRPGLLDVVKRVVKVEGWTGLFKGVLPSLISLGTSMVLPLMEVMGGVPPVFALLVSTCVNIPTTALINRYVTSPSPAPSFQGLVPRGPLDLLTTPGLFAANILYSTTTTLMRFASVRVVVSGIQEVNAGAPPSALAGAVMAAMLLRLVETAWTVPLDVLNVRLSLLSAAEAAPSAEEKPLQPTETVVTLRPARYAGLLDAAASITKEEGWRALYSTWGWTALLSLGSAWFEFSALVSN